MIKETLIQIYTNDLQKVIREIETYDSDEDVWGIQDGIANSGGTLALHLIGNIKHYIGANLGETGYERKRDLEFSDRNISRKNIIQGVNEAIEVLQNALGNLSDADFQKDYPELLGDEPQTTFTVVVYMLSHLNYHIGQINYHRRLITKD